MARSTTIRIGLPLVLGWLVLAPTALAQDNEQASIFTENGYELRRDERIFTLMAALNVAGFDTGELISAKPFPRYAFHPLRIKIRQALAPATEKLQGPVNRYLDAHSETLSAYVNAALTLATDASFTSSDQTPRAFAGLDKMLAEFAEEAKLSNLFGSLALDYRDLFKQLKPLVDGPFAQLRGAYHMNEESAPNLVLVPNVLGNSDFVLARRAVEGIHVVVFGLPADDHRLERELDLKPALRAYSALLAQEAAADVTATGIDEALRTLKSRGTLSKEVTAENMIRESLRQAVESKLWSKDPEADVEAAYRKGFLYVREFLKALDEPNDAFPTANGSFVAQVVARLDLHKTLTEADKPPTVQ